MEANMKCKTLDDSIIHVKQHEHPLRLVDLQPKFPNYEEESEYQYDDEEEEENLIMKWDFSRPCCQCGKKITFYHRYYYKCTHEDSCNYLLHKLCVNQLPTTLVHNVHSIDHKLENHIIYHPSHPHPLVCAIIEPISCKCDACGKEHKGIFFQCTTCFQHTIHIDCAFLPKKLQIDHHSTNHPLILSYSLPKSEQKAKSLPRCRICRHQFDNRYMDDYLWIYKCDKCRYYVHLDCATSTKVSFLLKGGDQTSIKTFEDDKHPNLVNLPFPDQSYSILQHLYYKENGSIAFEGTLNHNVHQHPLHLVDVDMQHNINHKASSSSSSSFLSSTSSSNNNNSLISFHNPMKRIEVLCNGCVRPILNVPFYKCDQCSNFVLHVWCTRLPIKLPPNNPHHPQHALILLSNVTQKLASIFECEICEMHCNGFAYGCMKCEYYIDVSCAFIPEEITHDAHPNHILSRTRIIRTRWEGNSCVADENSFYHGVYAFSCATGTCDFALHPWCAFLLPHMIKHVFDKHLMELRYFPIENHKSEYFCEVCEEKLNPNMWFYHCDVCVQSIHPYCAPIILNCETPTPYKNSVSKYLNIKFGGIYRIEGHTHPLLLTCGIDSDANCSKCNRYLSRSVIFRCLDCKFAVHYDQRCGTEFYCNFGLMYYDSSRKNIV